MTASRTPTPAEELRGAGLRVTAARVALLDTVRHGDHLGVEAIASGVRDRVGYVSLQAVYDALHALTAAGLVQRIEPAGTADADAAPAATAGNARRPARNPATAARPRARTRRDGCEAAPGIWVMATLPSRRWHPVDAQPGRSRPTTRTAV
jgi:Ferric uptake regulator family